MATTVSQCEACSAVVNRRWGRCLVCQSPLRPSPVIGDRIWWQGKGPTEVLMTWEAGDGHTWCLAGAWPETAWVPESVITRVEAGRHG